MAAFNIASGTSIASKLTARPSGAAASSKDAEYQWEKAYLRTWDEIEEDAETGALVSRGPKDRRRAGGAAPGSALALIQRGMLRHVFLLLDASAAMVSTDLRPTRLFAAAAAAREFVKEYFDQNPISSLGVIVARDGVAEKVSELSGNPKRHVEAIERALKVASGQLSLQAGLDAALRTLALLPTYGTREVVVVMGALATVDASSLMATLAQCVEAGVRVSVVCLPGEVHVAAQITRDTGGTFVVPETYDALRGALLACGVPPPRRASDKGRLGEGPHSVRMGFPELVTECPGLCACHNELRSAGYVCPRCSARNCEVPTVCLVCGLQLVSAPALARSYHHLFPVAPFTEVGSAEGGEAARCDGCTARLHPTQPRYLCPDCTSAYCVDCDGVIHESLHNCPGCCG